MNNKKNIAIASALLACLIWAGNFVIARGVHEFIPPFTLSFWRWMVAFMFILPLSIKGIRLEWPIITANLKYIASMGVLGVAMFSALIYVAGHTTTTSNLAIISSTTPIFTLLLAGLLRHDKLSNRRIIGAVLAFVGAMVVINHGDITVLQSMSWRAGDLMMLVAATIWAGWSVALKLKPAGLSNMVMMAAIIVFGLFALAPLYVWELTTNPVDIWNWQAWAVFLYLGIFASVVGWLLWQYSIELIGSVRTSLIYYSIPLFSSLLAVLFLDETPQLYHLAGFLLVLSGVVVSNIRRDRQQ